MKPTIRNIAYAEAYAYADLDTYISDLALSTCWGDDPESEIPAAVISERTIELARLWHIAHEPVRALLGGRSIATAAEELCMPYRTLRNWCAGDRPIAPHIRLWLAELLGYK